MKSSLSLTQIFPSLQKCFDSSIPKSSPPPPPPPPLKFGFCYNFNILFLKQDQFLSPRWEIYQKKILKSFSKIEHFLFSITQHGLILPILFFKFHNEFFLLWSVTSLSINPQFMSGMFLFSADRNKTKRTEDPIHQAFYQIVDKDPLLSKLFSFCLLTLVNYADLRTAECIPVRFLNERRDKKPKMVKTTFSCSDNDFSFDPFRVDILASNVAYYWRRTDFAHEELKAYDDVEVDDLIGVDPPIEYSSTVSEEDLLLDQPYFYNPAKSSELQQQKDLLPKKKNKKAPEE